MSRLSSLGFSTNSKAADNIALTNLARGTNTFGSRTRSDLYKKPETVKRKANTVQGLTYPENIGEYFITFNFKKYQRSAPLVEPKLVNTETYINLPIPTNLQEQFTMQYTDKSLGLLGAIEQSVSDYVKSSGGDVSAGNSNRAYQLGKDFADSIKTGIKDPANLAYGINKLVGSLDTPLFGSVSGAFSKATGSTANPFLAVLFQGVNLRSHSFTYKFSPNSESEHNVLKKIVHEFKIRMHPERAGTGGILLLYPDVVDIYFGVKDKEPYFFKTCFLTSMTLNYAPSGTPAFFSMTKDPVEVEMQLSFKEIEIVTREDFKEPINTSNIP
jgi:hypothetical protein